MKVEMTFTISKQQCVSSFGKSPLSSKSNSCPKLLSRGKDLNKDKTDKGLSVWKSGLVIDYVSPPLFTKIKVKITYN